MTLRRILDTEKPERIAVALDAKGPTFRHEQFAEYKATREKAPEELIDQLDLIRAVVEAHGIPLFEIPGYEADDVIGTLAKQAESAGLDVQIVTGDKDFMQLVSDKVKLYNVFKRNVELEIQGREAVAEKFGTTPEHVIDVLALMGDASDNIPGVKGIGEKGAIKLIQEYGSVPRLLENLDEVKGKNKEKIENDRERLLLSLDLVTIHTDVPLPMSGDELPEYAPDPQRLADLFHQLDFRSLTDKMRKAAAQAGGGDAASKTDQPTIEREYSTIHNLAELEAMEQELRAAGTFAVDTETTGLSPLEVSLVGVSFSARAGRAFYVPFNATPPVLEGGPSALLDALRPLLTDPELRRVGQNFKYDGLVFHAHGIEVPPPAFDTMVASFTVAGADRRHNLDALALHYFDIHKIPTSELIGTGKKQITMAEVMVEQVAEYACEDADVTYRLYETLEAEISEAGFESLYYDLELPLVPVLQNMERRGIRLDTDALQQLGAELEKDMEAAQADVRRIAGVSDLNLNSPKALGAVLFESLEIQKEAGVKRPKRTKTGWATDHATLTQNYANVEIVQRLLEFREVSKLRSTYVEALPRHVNPRTGRVHCHFSQVSAATGRLASSDPNLQNIPVRSARGRRLREAFVPRQPDDQGDWVLLAADYSQVELRIMAHLSKDPGLTQAFSEGRDIHASTAATIFEIDPNEVDREKRSQAKAINFGLLYGMGSQRLARETGLSVAEAKAFMERYFEAFPAVKSWIDGLLEQAPRGWLRRNAFRAPPQSARAHFEESAHGGHGPKRGGQYPGAGFRGGHHQTRDDRLGWAPQRVAESRAIALAGPRRTVARSAPVGVGGDTRDRPRLHGKCGETGRAFDRRLRARCELARGPLTPGIKPNMLEEQPFPCPCCDFFTLPARHSYLICPVCYWEDDGQDLDRLDDVSVPNHMTLRAARRNFKSFGACEQAALSLVAPLEDRDGLRRESR